MKILFFGDSITDMRRDREALASTCFSYGVGYPLLVTSELSKINPLKHKVINKGISGNRVVDLYARIKADVWNFQPDLISILIGVNDVWHEISHKNGVELDRFEKVYSAVIEDTKKTLPNVKMVLLEPFVLKGTATEEKYDEFLMVKEYAKVVKKLAKKYGLYFIPLQEKFDKMSEQYGAEIFLYDGVHPDVAGATLISNAWLEFFRKEIEI